MYHWDRIKKDTGHLTTGIHLPIVYKITDQHGKSFGGMQWGNGVSHTSPGKIYGHDGEVLISEPPISTKHWLHAYTSPILAILLNPVHGRVQYPKLWVCSAITGVKSVDEQVGCTWLKTEYVTHLPIIGTINRARWAILAASKVYQDKGYEIWANNWLSDFEREPSVDTKLANYISSSVIKQYKKCVDCAAIWGGWAAHWSVLAAQHSMSWDKETVRLSEMFAGMAGVYATLSAYHQNIKLSLEEVAEHAFSP